MKQFSQNLARANMAADRGITTYGADRYDDRMKASRVCLISSATVEAEAGNEVSNCGKREPGTKVPTNRLEFSIGEVKEGTGSGDAIKMFAALPPPTLRAAQKDALAGLEASMRIVGVDREMREVEVRVRRARKYLAKAEELKLREAQRSDVKDEGEAGLEKILEGVRKTAIV